VDNSVYLRPGSFGKTWWKTGFERRRFHLGFLISRSAWIVHGGYQCSGYCGKALFCKAHTDFIHRFIMC